METKSRYEVIAELEGKKRELIRERDGMKEELSRKEDSVTRLERQKADNNVILDRQIEDSRKDVERFKANIEERKVTIGELIRSVEDSLERFNKLQKAPNITWNHSS